MFSTEDPWCKAFQQSWEEFTRHIGVCCTMRKWFLRSLKLSSILTPWLDGLRHKKCKMGEEGEIKPWQNCRKVFWCCNLTCKVPTWAFFALLHFWHGRIHKWNSIQRNSNAFFFFLSADYPIRLWSKSLRCHSYQIQMNIFSPGILKTFVKFCLDLH